ncbi:MAG: hypothetical protein MRJ93_14095 [Nitrososphaeraceae archaeon]|nr:hypothetical protein [Nitrososphaeraceae archaeon]
MADDQKDLERLIQLYENKSKNFEKYFAILIGISLFVFFFMLFPYVYIQILETNLSKQLDINNKNLKEKLADRNTLNETSAKISLGNKTFNNRLDFVITEFGQFYNYLRNISNKNNDTITSHDFITEKNCEVVNNNTKNWINCNLNYKSIDMKNILNETLNQQIIFPLNNLNSSNYNELKNNLNSIIENIQLKLYNLNLLLTNDSDTSNERIKHELSRLNEEVINIFNTINIKLSQINNEINERKQETMILKQKLTDLNEERNDIQSLLNEFESPLGKLTVGFDHVILIFPLLLISGFIFCLSILSDANSTRKILLKNYKIPHQHITTLEKEESNSTINTEDIFPIFMDRTKSIKALVLFVPLFIFVISCVVIVLSWYNSTESTFGYDQNYRHIFLILYALFGIIGGIITCFQIKKY